MHACTSEQEWIELEQGAVHVKWAKVYSQVVLCLAPFQKVIRPPLQAAQCSSHNVIGKSRQLPAHLGSTVVVWCRQQLLDAYKYLRTQTCSAKGGAGAAYADTHGYLFDGYARCPVRVRVQDAQADVPGVVHCTSRCQQGVRQLNGSSVMSHH